MRYLKRFPRALLAVAIGLAPAVPATAQGVSSDLVQEWTKFPKPPKQLNGDPMMSAVLLIDFDLKGELGNSRVDGAALVRVGDREPILAAPIKGDLVMFHALEPGTYALGFIRILVYKGGDLQPEEILGQAPTLDINVSVGRGGLYYAGTVVVSRKFRVLGSRPMQFQLVSDSQREIEAWSAFKKKYADSPWAAQADSRIVALRSPDQAHNVAVARTASTAREGPDSAKGSVVYDACMDRETKAFQAQGHGDKSQTMAHLVCKIVSSGPPDDSAAVERRMIALDNVAMSHIRSREYGAAIRAYEEAIGLRPDSSDVTRSRVRRGVQNNLAWYLATAPDSAVRDGLRALALAQQLVAWKPDDAAYLDTFAAAYAEVGRFEDAVRTQREAVARIGRGSRDEYRKHLKSYEGGKPWREP